MRRTITSIDARIETTVTRQGIESELCENGAKTQECPSGHEGVLQ